jgi:cytochrome c-type biogenesis protein
MFMDFNVGFGLAFLAGLASFLSPCVFSLVPAYIGYLSGRSIARTEGGGSINRWETFAHGLAFVLGFSIIFVLLGLVASSIGRLLFDLRPILSKIGGVVVILFGLHMTGLVRIPFLEYDLRPQTNMDQNRSFLSSAMMGIFFSFGWSPCTGPVLGSILTLVMNGGSVSQGAGLLSAYSAGLAIPFLIASIAIGGATQLIRKYRKTMHYIEIGMGVILIGVGLMLFFGIFAQLARFGVFVDFGL